MKVPKKTARCRNSPSTQGSGTAPLRQSCFPEARAIEAVSLLYLFLPSLIFIFGYLRWRYAIPTGTILGIALIQYLRDIQQSSPPEEDRHIAPTTFRQRILITHAAIFLTIFIIMLLSGVGNFAFQPRDYFKHNAVLRDLVEFPWPTAYTGSALNQSDGVFAYYLGYYLPGAILGKLFGYAAAEYFQFFWTGLGLWLACMWFLRLTGRASYTMALLFLLFGGLDIIAFACTRRLPSIAHGNIDFWIAAYIVPFKNLGAMLLFYLSHFSQLQWIPHHAIGTWVAMGMLLNLTRREYGPRNMFFLCASVPLWAFFSAVGLIPFLAVIVMRQFFREIHRFISFRNLIAGPVLVALTGLFLMSNNAHIKQGFLWNFRVDWLLLFWFYVIEFGAYAAVRAFIATEGISRNDKILFWTAFASLMIIPLYHFGMANDFVNKASTPALFILAWGLGQAVVHARPGVSTVLARILVLLICLGAVGSLSGLAGSVRMGVHFNRASALENALHCDQLIQRFQNEAPYMGSTDTFFWKHLAKPVQVYSGPAYSPVSVQDQS